MPSKTEVSERARKCAEEASDELLDMGGYETSSPKTFVDDLAAIIARHFAGYEELVYQCAEFRKLVEFAIGALERRAAEAKEVESALAKLSGFALRRARLEPIEDKK